MEGYLERFKFLLKNFSVSDVYEILLLTILIYNVLAFLKKNNARFVMRVYIAFTLATGILFFMSHDWDKDSFILMQGIFLLLLFVIFNVELKKQIWSLDKHRIFEIRDGDFDDDSNKMEKSTTELIRAMQNMSKNDVGALIVLMVKDVSTPIVESGIEIDSEISSQIIESIFYKGTPLHDGATLIKGSRIVASGCFLPLTQNDISLPKDLGTRHRAGIGVTESMDVIALLVSEETGIISIACEGQLKRYVDVVMLKKVLEAYYQGRTTKEIKNILFKDKEETLEEEYRENKD